jgi:hypothetical protein
MKANLQPLFPVPDLARTRKECRDRIAKGLIFGVKFHDQASVAFG